ncbi:hypothetical protein [Halocola ammonii]
MVKKILLVVVITLSVSFCGQAQSASADSGQEASTEMEEEVVDGFWSVTTYLGKKLVDGMSERLNLDDENEKKEAPRKKVVLRIGTIEFERIEGG